MRMISPTTVQKPAIAPITTASQWYASCEMPTASVHDLGITRPMMCPPITNNSPKWNSGLPQRSRRDSYSCEDRVVQPNLS